MAFVQEACAKEGGYSLTCWVGVSNPNTESLPYQQHIPTPKASPPNLKETTLFIYDRSTLQLNP